MKALLSACLLMSVGLLIAVSCGHDMGPNPSPTPVPVPQVVDFEVKGLTVEIKGVLKKGAQTTVNEAKRSMKTAVELIDAEK